MKLPIQKRSVIQRNMKTASILWILEGVVIIALAVAKYVFHLF